MRLMTVDVTVRDRLLDMLSFSEVATEKQQVLDRLDTDCWQAWIGRGEGSQTKITSLLLTISGSERLRRSAQARQMVCSFLYRVGAFCGLTRRGEVRPKQKKRSSSSLLRHACCDP
jgi:hypothetical protein